MKVEKIIITKEVKEEQTLVKYTQEDIEQLIRVDLFNQGYEVDDISIITDMKYVEDEWGMNRHPRTYFRGVNVLVK